MKQQHRIGIWILLIQGGTYLALFVGCSALWVKADTWAMPKATKYWSENRRFVLEVLPHDLSNERLGCRAVLSEMRSTGEPARLVQVALTNSMSPVSALVSDDGQHFITLDEWHNVGGGDAVLAFYSRRGLLRNYSLEDVVGEQAGVSWWNSFPHSVSSRWWRNHCLMFFGENRQAGRFGIWLDWAPRWLIWNLTDGRPVENAAATVADWNERGSAWARSRFTGASGISDKITACRYALYSHRLEDRDLLEQALADGSQDLNHRQLVRLNADRALAIWDGQATGFADLEHAVPERHYLLGSVNVTLRLPAPATEGQVYLTLFPEEVKASDWKNAPAEFRGGRSFRNLYGQPESKLEIEFRINPARPGRYWLKAVWDRKPPFSYDLWSLDGFQAWLASTNNVITFQPGDAESGAPEVFNVEATKSVDVALECHWINER